MNRSASSLSCSRPALVSKASLWVKVAGMSESRVSSFERDGFVTWEWDLSQRTLSVANSSESISLSETDWMGELPPSERTRVEYLRRSVEASSHYVAEFLVDPMSSTSTSSAAPVRALERGIMDSDSRVVHGVTVLGPATDETGLAVRHRLQALGSLASGVAHDFSNLLTAVYGYSHLALEQLPDGHGARASIEVIQEAIDDATSVTRSLLSFAGSDGSDQVCIDLTVLASDTLRLLRRLLPSPIQLIEDFPDGPLPICGNPVQLQHMIVNLALNARDAMSGRGELRIATHRDGLECAVLEVSDTGCGMDTETMSRLLAPRQTLAPGAGHGLPVVLEIAAEHEAVVTMESEPGRGATVRVRIALTSEDDFAKAGSVSSPPTGARLLLAEDDEYVRKIMLTALEGASFRVTAARAGDEAVEFFEAAPFDFDLVILDLDLPGLSGWGCLELIRALRPEIPVAIVTGGPTVAPEDVAPTGPLAFLQKPFRLPDLINTLTRILQERT